MKPYLTGHYTPHADEITAHDLTVEGHLPLELSGRLLRNGHNPKPGVGRTFGHGRVDLTAGHLPVRWFRRGAGAQNMGVTSPCGEGHLRTRIGPGAEGSAGCEEG
ncbi:carotenoid oxygenase family protein [Streptomyces fulvorobeus]|uniref:Uncharacterized protein n=1 Tax=Streptomyces fulvorobeus TaxID=284028 RepID=A0A7J0CGP8_9ACTN|nr:carotenoid oxygenase family protein [Streptomyces fulvorobeus]NYE44415.1 hypothetical protein [Streptomyces fulvorobeus]GFN00945.1 hypothetical protein Sfulv_57550 [Streptomyces fulvorobeus]